ncbi:MAG: O-antigen ligase family protein [Candidatus Cloacimonetes bacterium]|nr:O-antigen ligase family protein [Candidatus Cloacimonadota bacterium]
MLFDINRIKISHLNKLDWILLLFLLVNCISGINAQNYQNFMFKLLHLMGFTFFYFIVSIQVFDQKYKRDLVILFLFLTVILVVCGIWDIIQTLSKGQAIQYISGIYLTRGRYAANLGFLYIFLCTVVYFVKNSTKFRWIEIISYVLIGSLIGFTYMRGIYLGLFMSLLCSIYWIKSKRIKLIMTKSLIIYLLLISFFIFVPKLNTPFIQKLKLDHLSEEYNIGKESTFGLIKSKDEVNSNLQKYKSNTMLSRFYYYSAAIKMFVDYPILGVGIGNSGYYLKRYADKRYYNYLLELQKVSGNHSIYKVYPHNIFLRIAAENGILGIISLLTLILILYRTIRKLSKQIHYSWLVFITTSLMFIFIQSLFDDFINRNIFWISIGLLSSLEKTTSID